MIQYVQQKTNLILSIFSVIILDNLHKIILLYTNEMLKSNINKSKPKEWSQTPLSVTIRCVTMNRWIHDTGDEAKVISVKFLMLGDDLSVWDFQSSMTFPWLLMIFQSSMTFHDFSRKFYFSRFSRFSRPCGNPEYNQSQMSTGPQSECIINLLHHTNGGSANKSLYECLHKTTMFEYMTAENMASTNSQPSTQSEVNINVIFFIQVSMLHTVTD